MNAISQNVVHCTCLCWQVLWGDHICTQSDANLCHRLAILPHHSYNSLKAGFAIPGSIITDALSSSAYRH